MKGSGKAIVTTLGVIVLVAVIIVLMRICGVETWVPFLALTLWAAFGAKTDWKSILSAHASILFGLALGYLLGNRETLGNWALIVFLVLIVVMLHCIVNKRFPFLFNNYTAAFVTVATSMSYGIHILKDWAFGFILFGCVPALVAGIIRRKKSAEAPKTDPVS